MTTSSTIIQYCTHFNNIDESQYDTNDVNAAIDYLLKKMHKYQFIRSVIEQIQLITTQYGIIARTKSAISIYIFENSRSKGYYKKAYREYAENRIVITERSCEIGQYLFRKGIAYINLDDMHFIDESLRMIENYYGTDIAERSGVNKMNHIYEGCNIILNDDSVKVNVIDKQIAMSAYAIHPIMQPTKNNEYFDINILTREGNTPKINARTIYYGALYGEIANSYLSHHMFTPETYKTIKQKLKNLPIVRLMLVADKIQNYKDFCKYHDNHARRFELEKYFKNWFDILELDDNYVQTMIDNIELLYAKIKSNTTVSIQSMSTK